MAKASGKSITTPRKLLGLPWRTPNLPFVITQFALSYKDVINSCGKEVLVRILRDTIEKVPEKVLFGTD